MSPRDSALFITDNAEHVFVNTEGVNFVADLVIVYIMMVFHILSMHCLL